MARLAFIELLEDRRLLSVSAASLFGPLTPGLTRTYQLTSDGGNATSKQVIKGPATFQGHAATEIDSTSSVNPGNLFKSFFGFDNAGNAVTYGSSGQSLIGPFQEVNTPPAIEFPAQIDAGVTYTENWATSTNSGGFVSNSTTKHEVKLTSASLVSVTVPAGTFSTYLFNITDTVTTGGFPSVLTTQEWFAPGKGLIKSVDDDGATTQLIPNQTIGAPAKLVISQQPTTATVGAAMAPPIKVAIADANGNVVTSNTSTVTLSIFSGPGGGALSGTLSVAAVGGIATFTNVKASVAGAYVIQAKSGSLTLAKTFSIQVAANQTASKLAFLGVPPSGTVGKPLQPSVIVGIETAAGQIVQGNTSKVTLAIASGPSGGTIGGTTAVNAVNGVATFNNLTFSKAGIYTIKATDGALTPATSSTITITAGATATKLAFVAPPHAGPAAKALSPAVKVAVQAANNSVVTSDTAKVTLSIVSGPAGGTISGTAAVNAVAGVATFSNLIFNKTGTYTIKATDGSLTPVTSATFTITAGAAAKLAFFVQPVNTVAGKAIAPAVKVRILDAAGNVVTSNTSTVTIAISTGPSGATLGGTKSVNAVAGVATFNNLILTRTGSYKLKATDGALTLATSNSFNVTAAAAAKLLIAVQPPTTTSTIAGKAIAPAVKVKVVDAFGNVVATNTSTVKFTVNSGPTGGALSGTVSANAVAGVATFGNLILKTAGTYVLKATDGSLTSALTSSFKIAAAVASKLVFTQQPATGKVNTTLAPAIKVAVEDAFGNIVLTNTSSVVLALASGPSGGTLGGTLSVHAVAGIATFTTLKLSKAGTYVIKATDGTLASALSKNIVITT